MDDRRRDEKMKKDIVMTRIDMFCIHILYYTRRQYVI